MKFNNGAERKKFEKRWNELKKTYVEAGMSEEGIQAMYEYDWNDYKKERVFREHNQYIPDSDFGDDGVADEGQCSLLEKFQEKFATVDTYTTGYRYEWIDEIDSEQIHKILNSLSESNKEVLTMYVIEEKTQEEIATHMGISRSSVADRICLIRKKLKKVLL